MIHRHILISLLLLFCIHPPTIISAIEHAPSKTAEHAYQTKQYQDAQTLYKIQLKQDPKNPHILYNLGNSYYHDNKLGLAILYYLKAQQLMPRDPDIKHNLTVVQSQIIDTITPNLSPYTLIQRIAKHATLQEYSVILLMCITILNSLLFLRKRNGDSPALRPALISCLVLLICMTLLTLTSAYTQLISNRIVITQSKVELKEGPSQSLETTLLLHEGVQATILKQNDTWSFIRCDNNITGWVPKSSFLSI